MNIIQVFSTPIWESSLPEFNHHKDIFLEAAKEFRQKNPVVVEKSKLGDSYHGTQLLGDERFSHLFNYITQMCMKAAFDLQFVDCDVYITEAWLNFNDNRSCINYEHVHGDTFSGVFYLQIPKNSGKLVIINPGINPLWQGTLLTGNKNKFNSTKLKLDPVEGHIFLWPGYLPHGVEPNDHDDSRISIAFNLMCLPKNNKDSKNENLVK